MTKLLPELLRKRDALEREIRRVRLKEVSAETMADRFPYVPAAKRKRLQGCWLHRRNEMTLLHPSTVANSSNGCEIWRKPGVRLA